MRLADCTLLAYNITLPGKTCWTSLNVDRPKPLHTSWSPLDHNIAIGGNQYLSQVFTDASFCVRVHVALTRVRVGRFLSSEIRIFPKS
jgi:hypothetical protein